MWEKAKVREEQQEGRDEGFLPPPPLELWRQRLPSFSFVRHADPNYHNFMDC